ATSQICIADQPGNYSLEITDVNGCVAVSTPVLISGLEEVGVEAVNIYPNPSFDGTSLTVHSSLVNAMMEVYDANGRLVFHSALSTLNSAFELQVQKGIYFIRIHNERVSV